MKKTSIIIGAVLLSLNAWAQMPNPYGPSITLDHARKIAAAASAEAKKNGWNVAVAIVDTAGELVYFEKNDNTQVSSVKTSQEKARTAARFKRPTKLMEEAIAGGRVALLALPDATPIEGGLPLLIDGKIVGAVGVSGATSPQDGQCAQAGVDTLPKAPAPAAPPAKK